tara:strand:- start:291 stop:488 length:198 start_codon:yes stop_codon:yes gene_type:complete
MRIFTPNNFNKALMKRSAIKVWCPFSTLENIDYAALHQGYTIFFLLKKKQKVIHYVIISFNFFLS